MLANKLMSALSGGAEDKLYVDDVFSAYTYTGNGSAQTINNGIDLAGKGGLVWTKQRSSTIGSSLIDSVRGVAKNLAPSATDGEYTNADRITALSSTGFAIGSSTYHNQNAATYVSWTFRKAPKFFDVVTYTGNGVAGRQIPHSLGIAPGMVIVKRTDAAIGWFVYHRDLGDSKYLVLSDTSAVSTSTTVWGAPTDSVFTVGTYGATNAAGAQYVAYLFAHDPSADGIIQCGSYAGNGSATGPVVNLGWEPQYLMIKNASGTGDWIMFDSMRGMPVRASDALLSANTTAAEMSAGRVDPSATGFSLTTSDTWFNGAGRNYIYLAIRRPNKPPTTGTEVYNAIARTGTGAVATVTGVGFAPDLVISTNRPGVSIIKSLFANRSSGNGFMAALESSAENTNTAFYPTDYLSVMDGYKVGAASALNEIGKGIVHWAFRRAPGFFDVVCYTGTGVAITVPHSLGVAPELMIVKCRSTAGFNWVVYSSALGIDKYIVLSSANAAGAVNLFGNTPVSTQFTVSDNPNINQAAWTYVAYLFASLPGISKVGSYTGNGTTQTVNCGFTTGARFILIKRTDSTGDWYIWDTARGIVSANDPHLSLNTTAAEVTTDDSVDPDASGFIVNQVAATNINVSGGQYIFLAIA